MEKDSMEHVKLGQRLIPSLLVRDMSETLAFYQKLGFQVTGRSSDGPSPEWAEVTRNSIILQFYSDPPHGTPSAPVCSGTFYIYSESVAALADEFRGKVEFAWGPEVMDYGMLEFGIRDPNGYFLAFTEPVDKKQEI
jgi:catechol 2,3-dioxygenase-like lactoylglutathione lyase family enzyme